MLIRRSRPLGPVFVVLINSQAAQGGRQHVSVYHGYVPVESTVALGPEPFSTRSTKDDDGGMTHVQPIGPPKAPGPSLRIAILLIVAGVALAIPTFMVGIIPIVRDVASPLRFETPGPVDVHLGKGTWEIYENTGSASIGSSFSTDDTVTITPADVTVTAVAGARVEVFERGSTVESRTTSGRRYVGAVRFTTPASGDYLVTVRTTSPQSVLVARPLTFTIRKAIVWFVLMGTGGILTAVGIVLLIVGSVRRGRARRTPTYAYAAPVPPGWHPDPGGSAQLRYWDGYRWTEHLQ